MKIGHGIFMWTAEERRQRRYGYIYLDSSDYRETASCKPSMDESMIGKRIMLWAIIVESRESGHNGDRFLEVFPSRSEAGEKIVVGIGTLVKNKEPYSPSGFSIGLRPSDGREELWMDPRILYRLHDQTVDLYAEETRKPDSPKTTLVYGDTDGAISNGDGTIQFLAPPSGKVGNTVLIKPNISMLQTEDVLIAAISPPWVPGNQGERFAIEHQD